MKVNLEKKKRNNITIQVCLTTIDTYTLSVYTVQIHTVYIYCVHVHITHQNEHKIFLFLRIQPRKILNY